jgi:hypothetical protein
VRAELSPKAERYLERTARALSRGAGRRVRSEEVLELLVELAIADEGVYEPETGVLLPNTERALSQPARARESEPSGRLALQRLSRRLQDEG